MSLPACKLRRVGLGGCSAVPKTGTAAAEMEQRLAKAQKERAEMDSMWSRPGALGGASVEKNLDRGFGQGRPTGG
jgi:hypothetical protein